MEAFSIFRFWRNYAAVDVGSDGDSSANGAGKASDDARNSALSTDDEETDDEDSLFDLVLKSPKSVDVGGEEALKKKSRFNESPRDVFLSKSDVSNSKLRASSQVSVVRLTPKFRVFMFGLRKSPRCEKNEEEGEIRVNRVNQVSKMAGIERSFKIYAKRRAEEFQTTSVFARDNSLRSKILQDRFEFEDGTSTYVGLPEKPSRDSVPKYLKLIKPLYGKVSRRQSEKENRLRGSLTPSEYPVTAAVNVTRVSDGCRAGSLKSVSRHLVKNRSASVPQPELRRRDDSLLEQQDGIQGAILHCKKSFNPSFTESARLIHFSSNNLHENSGRNSCEELKRSSI